jgi:hypothetical protein
MNYPHPAESLDRIVMACARWITQHKKASGFLVLAMLLGFQATVPSPVTRGIVGPVNNVQDFISYDPPGADPARNIRASGSDVETTATTTAADPVVALASATSFEQGHDVAIMGAGPAHGISAPSNVYAIPISVAQTAPLTSSLSGPIRISTVDATNNAIILGTTATTDLSNYVHLALKTGQGVRLSNQGGALPTHSAGSFTENTQTYYTSPQWEMTTVANAGTATGGTYELRLLYEARNPKFHAIFDSSLYTNIPYNAGWEVQTVTLINNGGTPGGTFTLSLTGYGTTGAITWDATTATMASNMQTALRAVTGLSRVTVAFTSGNYTAGAVFTVILNGAEGNVAQMTSVDSMTGTVHSTAHATASGGTASSFQTYVRSLPGCSQIIVDQAGTSPNFTHTITWIGKPGRTSLAYNLAELTGGTPTCTITSTRSGGYYLHDTEAHAIAGTDIYDLNNDASGTNNVEVYGSTTYSFRVAGQSGDGGVTEQSSVATTTVGPDKVDEFQRIAVCWDKDASCEGYVVYGDSASDYKPQASLNQLSIYHRVTLDAGGFTAFEHGDIGRTLSDGTNSGTIACFDNASRNVWIARANTAGFPTNGATITTTSGTGGGTQVGASVRACIWFHTGNRFRREYNYYGQLRRRGGERCYPGQLMEWNGRFYNCVSVTEDRKTNADLTFTVNTTTDTLTFSATPAVVTNGTRLYLTTSHTLPLGITEQTVVYGRYSGATATLHPTAGDATANTNKIDLTSEGVGTQYAANPPNFSTTIGEFTNDQEVLWECRSQAYPATPPSAAIPDYLPTTIVSKSGNNITVNPAPDSSGSGLLVLHDDFAAVLAHHNAANAASTRSRQVYFPQGRYRFVIPKVSGDARLFNEPFGSGLDRVGFRWGINSLDWTPCSWEGEPGVSIICGNLNTTGKHNSVTGFSGDGNSGFYLHTYGRTEPLFKNIKWYLQPLGVAKSENPDGATSWVFNAHDVSSTSGSGPHAGPRIKGARYTKCSWYNWHGLPASIWEGNLTSGDFYDDCEGYYGGNNHDAGAYTVGGYFNRVYFVGIGPDRSQMFYHDAASGIPLNISDSYCEGARKDGIAIRGDGTKIRSSVFSDCIKIFSREWVRGLHISDCDLFETDFIPNNSTNNGSRDVFASQLRMTDSDIAFGSTNENVKVRDITIRTSARPRRFTIPEVAAGFGGTNQDIDNVTIDNRAAYNMDYRSVTFAGNGINTFSRVKVTASRGAWQTFSTSGSGFSIMDKCEFFTTTGGSTACLTQHTGNTKWIDCRFQGTPYSFASGGRTEFINSNSESGAGLTFTSGITGPLYFKGGQYLGTVTFQEPSTVVEGVNFATTPTLTGATLNLKRNKVADVDQVNIASPIAASANNYALPVTDLAIVTLTGDQNMTGVVATANGVTKTLLNNDGTDTLTVKHQDAASDAANRITTPSGGDLAIAPGKRLRLERMNDVWYATAP